MPCAAPGVIARGALRQTISENIDMAVRKLNRYVVGDSSQYGKEIHFHPGERNFLKSVYFTLHLSGFGVDSGRLGEVVSLVGDCRPPPPGNPRQPTILRSINPSDGGLRENPTKLKSGFFDFTQKRQKNGGFFLPMCMCPSLNNLINQSNLNKLNFPQYFKNTYSYFSCTVFRYVLKFVHFHCHLYGVWFVEPPAIAITNVLENRDYHYALSLL
ncbi:MAG: hypothetical protein A2032_05315 [Chloroflexi bacterium RBG_19FT_COMBO_49_13]|nr:MAG: hypothetical protein A2032_05315 [Chloroflexi bacterium RBG_19FT_COMBO_49_13]